MESLLDQLVIGILLMDREGRVEFANSFCIERELTARRYEGKRYYETVRSLSLISLLGEFLEGRGSSGEFEHRDRHYRVLCRAGELYLIQIEDITPYRDLERMRREFVASVSHELSTPLAAVRGLLETMLLSDNPGKELIERAIRRVGEFEDLINSIKLLTLVERGGGEAVGEVRVDEVVEAVLGDLRSEMEEKGLELEVRVEEGVTVRCDREKIYILLRNIIGNAIRYNREGGKVEVAVWRSPEGVKLEVSDTGRGIPRRDLPFIFTPFFRSGEGGGLGLGLAISKRIVEFCRGRIEVESEAGRGTVVRILFPLQSPNL